MDATTRIEQQLRDAIQASGQSLSQLGQSCGVDAGRLSRFMRGERSLTLEGVGRLCQVLGLQLCPTEGTTGQDGGQVTSGKVGQVEDKPAPKKRKPRK